MLLAKEIAYHAARERACRQNAARAADDDAAARHHELAEMHAQRQRELLSEQG